MPRMDLQHIDDVKTKTGVHQAGTQALAVAGLLHVEKLFGELGRTVLRLEPTQIASLRTRWTVRQLASQLCKALRQCRGVCQLQQSLLGALCQGWHIHPGGDSEQDVAHPSGLPHRELRLVRVVVTL